MTAKEYLSQIYRIQLVIDSMQAEIDALQAKADSLGGSSFGDKVQTSAKNDAGFVNVTLKILDLKAEREKKINEQIELQKKISSAIDSVGNPEERALLRNRYVNCYTWEAIAEIMGFSLRTIYYIHGRALQHIVIEE